MLSLFALTSNPAKRVARFVLSKPVQKEFSEHLRRQENSFDSACEEIPFNGTYKPDDGEVLYIDGYDDIDDLQSAISGSLTIPEVEPTEIFFEEIKALFTGYVKSGGVVKVLLQCFDRRKVISTNGLSIFHAANVYKKIEGIGLTIDTKLTATLEGGRLRFYSFHSASRILDLSEYFKVATDEDIKEFSRQSAISVSNFDGLLEISDSWVRRKISLVQQSGILQSVPIQNMRVAAEEFGVPFEVEDDNGVEKIRIPEIKADLKKLLRFLEEDYYKSPLSKVNYIANSKRAI